MKLVLKKRPKLNKRQMLSVIAVIMVLGLVTMLLTKALSPTNGLEAEDGTLTGNVGTIQDNSASGGQAVLFGYKDLFVSTTGSDNNNGLNSTSPVKTVTKALSLATGYTRIRIMAGDYVEQFRISKNNIIVEPYGNGDVNINGAIPEFLQPRSWTYVQPGIYKSDIGRSEFNVNGNTIYDKDGKQLWSYDSLIHLQNRYTVGQESGVFWNDFLFEHAAYVATDTNQPPTSPLYIGAANPSIDVMNATNVRIQGISGSKLKISYGTTNVQIRGSNNVTVKNVEIVGGTTGISAVDSDNVTIANNYLHGSWDKNWYYVDVKEKSDSKTMENQALLVRPTTKDTSNTIVDGNTITGYWGTIHFPTLFGHAGASTTEYFNRNTVISNNIVHDGVVGIEPEAPFDNLIIKKNIVYDEFEPFSPSPTFGGQSYVYENLFVANRYLPHDANEAAWGPSYSIKMHNDTLPGVPEHVHYFYNTFYQAGGHSNMRMTVQSTPNLIEKDMSFTNNIFYTYGGTGLGMGEGGIVRGSGREIDGVDWDGNNFYSEVPNAFENYFSWNILYDTADIAHRFSKLSDIIAAGQMPATWTGNTEGNPSFNCVDPANITCFKPSASIIQPSNLQQVPANFPESNRLNSRNKIGAFE